MTENTLNTPNTAYTPVADQDEKIDIMEHINQDHQDAVLVMVQHYHPKQSINTAIITDMFEEGALISHPRRIINSLKTYIINDLLYYFFILWRKKRTNF